MATQNKARIEERERGTEREEEGVIRRGRDDSSLTSPPSAPFALCSPDAIVARDGERDGDRDDDTDASANATASREGTRERERERDDPFFFASSPPPHPLSLPPFCFPHPLLPSLVLSPLSLSLALPKVDSKFSSHVSHVIGSFSLSLSSFLGLSKSASNQVECTSAYN